MVTCAGDELLKIQLFICDSFYTLPVTTTYKSRRSLVINEQALKSATSKILSDWSLPVATTYKLRRELAAYDESRKRVGMAASGRRFGVVSRSPFIDFAVFLALMSSAFDRSLCQLRRNEASLKLSALSPASAARTTKDPNQEHVPLSTSSRRTGPAIYHPGLRAGE